MLCSKRLSEALVLVNYTPKVDLFASNVNHQFHAYLSCKPEPKASGLDSLTADWSSLRIYAFPPSSVIPKVLKKVKTENAEGILVVTFWPNQPWSPLAFKILTDAPALLTSRKHLLHLPQHQQTLHPIWRKIDLLVYHLANSSQKTANYLKKLQASSKHHGNSQQGKDIRAICTNSRSIS